MISVDMVSYPNIHNDSQYTQNPLSYTDSNWSYLLEGETLLTISIYYLSECSQSKLSILVFSSDRGADHFLDSCKK